MIKDGDYCIFRANVVGSRQGKIVLAQHRDIQDPENGGKYTVKKYMSGKTYDADGEFRHERIVLEPINKNYAAIMDGVRPHL